MMESCKIGSLGPLSLSKAVIKGDVIKVEVEIKTDQEPRFEDKDTLPVYIYPKHLSCKIPLSNPNPLQINSPPHDDLISFLASNKIKYTMSATLSALWPYGRVITTSTGFHGEFHRKNDYFMSLMFLGKTEEDAINLMYRLVNQNVYLDTLK